MAYDSTTGACPRCNGLTTLRVVSPDGVIGYAVAEWPWNLHIPEDPEQHPTYPHYQVQWHALDAQGRDILDITATDPYFIARAIRDRFLPGSG